MRIGIFDPYLDGLGGGEKYMLSIASVLSEKHSVDIFWNNDSDVDKVKERFALDLSNVKIVKNIFLPKYSIIEKLLETRKYDIIIYLSDGSIPLVFSRKLILHFQFPVEWVNPSIKTKLKLSRVNKIICNSEFTKKYIDKKFNINSLILYPPVEIKTDIELKKENIILHVGRFQGTDIEGMDYKKQSVMVEVFKKMVKNGLKNWRFIIASGIRQEEAARFNEFRNAANGFPIEFLINCSNQDLSKVYSKSKIYWHASGLGENLVKHPEKAEHFGISTVEAMCAGCVPVVINAGGQPEIVTNAKDGFLWKNEEELVEKTLLLIKNNDTWVRMSKEAIKKSKKFNIKRFITELYDIVEK